MAHESILNPNSKQNLSTQEIWDSIQVVLFITKGENISELLSLMIEPINEILEEPIYGQVNYNSLFLNKMFFLYI